MTDFSRLGVAAIRDGVANGEFKAVEVAEDLNTRVSAAKALNAFIVETPEKAIEAARAVDADRAAGKPLGKMAGVPIGMKDLFCTEGVQTTAASHILEGFVPKAVKSFLGSQLALMPNDGLAVMAGPVTSQVWPSAGAFATASVPIFELAPGRASTMIGWFHIAPSLSVITRATTSTMPPAG